MRRFCVHRQISRQRSIDGREVRALQRLGAVRAISSPSIRIAPRSRLQDAQNHVDGRGLACSVRAQEPDDFIAPTSNEMPSTAIVSP